MRPIRTPTGETCGYVPHHVDPPRPETAAEGRLRQLTRDLAILPVRRGVLDWEIAQRTKVTPPAPK